MMNKINPRPGLMKPPKQPALEKLHAAARPMANKSKGSASTMSTVRDIKTSTHPPTKPAISPSTDPSATAMPVAPIATINDVRNPYIDLTKTSRPLRSAPNQKCAFGPFGKIGRASCRERVEMQGGDG